MKLTIVIPNRNRDLAIVKRSLRSVVDQASDTLAIVLVDYGSDIGYQKDLKKLINEIGNIKLILCPTQGQLWNKARAINIVLKSCTTPFFMVADVDMLFHPKFFHLVLPTLKKEQTIYFPVGVLTEEESKKDTPFEEYKIKFMTDHEATGISIFPTQDLLDINGFDEFYHGWGSEDTDAHVRLLNNGHEVEFQEETYYFLHQWHPKAYRSRDSKEPYCKGLEQTNANYLKQTRELKKTMANLNTSWGILPFEIDKESIDYELSITNKTASVKALVQQIEELEVNTSMHVTITQDDSYKNVKDGVKKILGKKTTDYIALDVVNDTLLGALIGVLRNSPYNYRYNRMTQQIHFQIKIMR